MRSIGSCLLLGATVAVPALRIDMSDDPGVGVLLTRVRDVLTAALTYQYVPMERPVPLFRVVRHFAEHGLYDVQP